MKAGVEGTRVMNAARKNTLRRSSRLLSIALAMLLYGSLCAAAEAPDFERDVAPLLVQHCLDCHQPNKLSGKLNLSSVTGLVTGGEQGPALELNKPESSLLIERIESGEMPPPEAKETRQLTSAEIKILREWIAAGAKWPKDRELGVHEKTVDLEKARQFWSFQPVRRPQVPTVQHRGRVANPIDEFIWQRLESSQITLAATATPRDLLRRVSLDVRGLPPTLEEQRQFLDDRSPDAYTRLVDRLLEDSAYGERWARHWLDLVRYADSNGYERDADKPSVWQYRDYVIRSLNHDKPYDRFVLEQLAGDELPDANFDTLVATGFHALGTWQDEVDPLEAAQYRADELDDMIRTTSQTFLGVTLGCARCHQHKFDPLTMVDYYSLSAILSPLKRPNQGRSDRDLPGGTPEQIAALTRRDETISQLERQIETLLLPHVEPWLKSGDSRLPKDVQAAWLTPADQRTPVQSRLIKTHQPVLNEELQSSALPEETKKQIVDLREQQRQQRVATPELPRVYRLFESSPRTQPTHLLLSGRASNPGPTMQPRVPAVLTTAQPKFSESGKHSTLRRLAFAEWVASPDNPLTARVMVNRVWQHHFGTGLVATSSDFGHIGARPTHPELLDWLAHWFVQEAGWSLKKLHRLILTSETYRQGSAWNEQAAKVDPENHLLWRYPYRRLDVESIRDSTLAVSGALNRTMYGPAVHFPVPEAVIEAHTDKQAAWKVSSEPDINRRTIYGYLKRTLVVPMLETFDFCDTTQSTERRSITSVATQALTLYNGEFVNRQAERFADRLEREAGSDADKQIELAYRLALSRQPTEDETRLLRQFLDREEAKQKQESTNASSDSAAAGHRALVQMCRAVLNLNEFVYPN
jgi:mono/diheme cytochrome c family protein